MHELSRQFSRAARSFPEYQALISAEEGRLTYHQLDRRVADCAAELEGQGIGPGDIVAMLLPKSFAAVTVILAVLRRGATYIPLDAAAPPSRTQYVLATAEPKLLVAARETSDVPTDWQPNPNKIDGPAEAFTFFLPVNSPSRRTAGEEELAYILFTSGSTGQPKGVTVSGAAAVAFVNWAGESFGVKPDDIVSSIAPFHFDLSVFDLFATLTRGACLMLLSDKTVRNPRLFAQRLAENQVTVLYATPSLLRLLHDHGKPTDHDLTALRQVLYAGEAYPVAELVKLMKLLPDARVANLYGPTETNVVTYHELTGMPDPEESFAIPIGRACPYAHLLIWQDGPVNPEAGMEGELLVAGASLTSGYLDEAANLTAFVTHHGDRYYRTGDLVSVDEDGNLVFLGRTDRMVKRRGYRVEPAESEAALATHHALTRVATVAGKVKDGAVRLVAYYELAPGADQPTGLELAAYCRERLPAYLVPDAFRVISTIPLTTNQKTDYLSLQNLADGK